MVGRGRQPTVSSCSLSASPVQEEEELFLEAGAPPLVVVVVVVEVAAAAAAAVAVAASVAFNNTPPTTIFFKSVSSGVWVVGGFLLLLPPPPPPPPPPPSPTPLAVAVMVVVVVVPLGEFLPLAEEAGEATTTPSPSTLRLTSSRACRSASKRSRTSSPCPGIIRTGASGPRSGRITLWALPLRLSSSKRAMKSPLPSTTSSSVSVSPGAEGGGSCRCCRRRRWWWWWWRWWEWWWSLLLSPCCWEFSVGLLRSSSCSRRLPRSFWPRLSLEGSPRAESSDVCLTN